MKFGNRLMMRLSSLFIQVNMKDQLAKEVFETMWMNDYFSQWLGLSAISIVNGACSMQLTIRKEMLNGHGTVHGGVLFAACDSVFAFACNSNNDVSVALDVSITYTRPAFEGDIITIHATRVHHGNRIGLYDVKALHANGQLICSFKGTCYTSSKQIVPSKNDNAL